MQNFAEILKAYRIKEKKTLKEVSTYINKSIGYLSDIEHQRKPPPKIEIIKAIENYLNIQDSSLLKSASNNNYKFIKKLKEKSKHNFNLYNLLVCLSNKDDQEIEEIINLLNHEKETIPKIL